ncbi:hypothetical protein ACMX25_18755 [Caballeronia sp. 15715]|uniref:hypothetical protein n=1 Tax=Caballeronia sp. 15715 TaxID=3391030 RepID=UPI0039E668C4
MSLVIIGGALMQVASGVVKHQAGMQGRMFRSYGISKKWMEQNQRAHAMPNLRVVIVNGIKLAKSQLTVNPKRILRL